jgi:hypothetical protein
MARCCDALGQQSQRPRAACTICIEARPAAAGAELAARHAKTGHQFCGFSEETLTWIRNSPERVPSPETFPPCRRLISFSLAPPNARRWPRSPAKLTAGTPGHEWRSAGVVVPRSRRRPVWRRHSRATIGIGEHRLEGAATSLAAVPAESSASQDRGGPRGAARAGYATCLRVKACRPARTSVSTGSGQSTTRIQCKVQ